MSWVCLEVVFRVFVWVGKRVVPWMQGVRTVKGAVETRFWWRQHIVGVVCLAKGVWTPLEVVDWPPLVVALTKGAPLEVI